MNLATEYLFGGHMGSVTPPSCHRSPLSLGSILKEPSLGVFLSAGGMLEKLEILEW